MRIRIGVDPVDVLSVGRTCSRGASLIAPGLAAQEPAVATDTIPTGPEGETVVEEDPDESGVDAGYEKNGWNGFFIRSKDGQFRLNIGAYTQIRYNMNWRTRPDSAHAE